ncbi:MAG: aminomethyl-transferring glycine dehydrogenase subunit GcvPA [Gammaproteobacteria bacterium]|nr:MAG: aminomethyl-transferring glycine dehydrogenase subunit GcvPA [Gammaproteobacteria bacterium]
MPWIPHSPEEVREMLARIGVASIDELFDEIPAGLRSDRPLQLPPAMNEAAVSRLMLERSLGDTPLLCFAGGGAYEHHVPATVWELAGRGEFYTAYTPYQAEASQGTMQVIYEYQSMMCQLLAMEVSNASLYDGATALAEAILMAVRANRRSRSRRVLLPRNIHPVYRQVARTLVTAQELELVEVPFDPATGLLDPQTVAAMAGEECAAVVIPQPDYFGGIEPVDELVRAVAPSGALVVGLVNPLAMALLRPPGQWGGAEGVDIACGEAQSLGLPLSSGGPYLGFLCCRERHVRQMPGRLVGRTVDDEGQPAFALTLQAREQHIRRSRATSNICTNQGLMMTAATIHMALMGGAGLRRAAAASHRATVELVEALTSLPGVEPLFDRLFFHETVLRLPLPPARVLEALEGHGILGGIDLSRAYPELGDALLVCATELRTGEDIESYRCALGRVLEQAA